MDDDALVPLNTTMMLEELGHTVVEAHSVAKALQVPEMETDFGLVITDKAMPHVTGIGLAAEIGRRWPGLPMIFGQRLSRYRRPSDLEDAAAG